MSVGRVQNTSNRLVISYTLSLLRPVREYEKWKDEKMKRFRTIFVRCRPAGTFAPLWTTAETINRLKQENYSCIEFLKIVSNNYRIHLSNILAAHLYLLSMHFCFFYCWNISKIPLENLNNYFIDLIVFLYVLQLYLSVLQPFLNNRIFILYCQFFDSQDKIVFLSSSSFVIIFFIVTDLLLSWTMNPSSIHQQSNFKKGQQKWNLHT